MAWRDTRTSRRRLMLYAASITLGIAALVLIASLGESLQHAVRDQSVALLGADFVASSREPFKPEAETFLNSLGGKQANEVALSSMALFTRTAHARLVSVRAVEDAFPFYGTLETEPVSAAAEFRAKPAVLVEESLLLQFGAQVGDEVKIGASTFVVAGALRKVPGESPGVSLVSARVYMSLRFLDGTKLIQPGSRADYRRYFAFAPGFDIERIRRENRDKLRGWGVRTETVTSREVSVGRAIENLESFLSLVGYVALVLGGVGVASGVHVYIRQKLASIAVLRCLGATTRQTFLVYLVQAFALGLIGAVVGAVVGLGLNALASYFLQGLFPFELKFAVSWRAIAQGLAAGVGVTLALALLPLLAVRRVSPLLALRSTIEPPRGSWRDPATLGVVAIALAAITLFAVQQATRWYVGVWFVVATMIVFGVLALVGLALMRLVRVATPARAPYVWRQGLANLFRPNNRTLLLIVALGLGTFLIVTMALVQGMLVGQLDLAQAEGRPNVILFDIQSDQRAGVRATIESQGMNVIEEAPIVTMRIASVKGVPIAELRRSMRGAGEPPSPEDREPRERRPRERGIAPWVLTREYRSSFRRELGSAEKIIAGKFVSEVPKGTKLIPISVEKDIATELQVGIGDTMSFDVQGTTVDCVIASLREVEWRRVQPNFFMVFPMGAIDDAPQFTIMATRAANDAQSAQLQRAMFDEFPNVSIIDLALILQTINRVMKWIGLAFSVMGIVVGGTGLFVLAGVMASGRFQRMRESVLLRTIGAARGQIARIQFIEYLLLGTLASFTGVVLAWCASWALGKWVFELSDLPAVIPMLVAWAIVSALTVAAGALSGRRLLNHPPLEVLRQET